MEIKNVSDPSFAQYGKVVEGYDISPLIKALLSTPKPAGSVVYVPGEPTLEALPIKNDFTNRLYGGMPVQIGYCNGDNNRLNCLEYHRDSEINIPADDVVLLLAKVQDIKDGTLDTSMVEAYLAPAGSIVQFYETTLHYAPCTASGNDGFRVAVVLPLGTNTEKPDITAQNAEDKLLWARNKWLIAHPDAPESKDGAHTGLTGENIII